MAVLYQKAVWNMIKEFRRNWRALCSSERTTVCGADSMLLALQLSMAENNKQYSGEFTVSLSDVLLAWKYLLHEKLDLPVENMEAIDHYEDIRKNYDDFLKNSNMIDLIDVYQKCKILPSNCEKNDKLSPSQLQDFLLGKQYTGDDETDLYVPTSPTRKDNQDTAKVQLLAKKIIYSYLNLLVNSKNDLALAYILNIPDRGLGREAFTDLRHAAQEKQMPIFLVATSFIRTIQLGGKGYAPSPSDPLRMHVKGLSNFINFMDKLGEILGEIPNPSVAGGRILSVIKTQLMKGQDSRDPFCEAVEQVAQDLDLRIKNIISSPQEDVAVYTTDISPARCTRHPESVRSRKEVKGTLMNCDERGMGAAHVHKGSSDAEAQSPATNTFRVVAAFFGASPGYLPPLHTLWMPKSHAINHGTVYCGRDTVKILLVLLDEEAADAPTQNKAKLLYDDENLIHNETSILTLFRSPIQVKNSLMKPLRERVQKSMQEKNKVKQTLIRSQFACTYKDDCMISKNKWNSVNWASDPLCVLQMENDSSEGGNISAGILTIGTSSGNVHQDRSKKKNISRKSSTQTGNKNSKRKQVDLDGENIFCDNGNEPLEQKDTKIPKTSKDSQNKLDVKLAGKVKGNKCTTKVKLISGQTKLTQFFRL